MNWVKRLFRSKFKQESFTFGPQDEDGYAIVLKDGKETNCRMYLWDPVEIKHLQRLAAEIHEENAKRLNQI